MKIRILIIILIYGICATSFSFLSWPNEGIHFILNLPGNLLGEMIYQNSIENIGDPTSSQAHFTIPWVLRIPQVFVLTSMVFWVGLGTGIQIFYNKLIVRI